MAVLASSPSSSSLPRHSFHSRSKLQYSVEPRRHHRCSRPAAVSAQQLCASSSETLKIDKSALTLSEAVTEEELWATSLLRVRSFYDFKPSVGIEEYKRNLTEREFEALKQRVAGTRAGFKRVACINATLPLSKFSSFPDDLCSACKFSNNGEDRVVVGTLDLNQCISLPDEITGSKPKGIGADFARAYLSNVCVAEECQRNGLAFALIEKSKLVAEDWGISDLYVHVAVNNEPAKNLYLKSGFIHESDEPAWQARFLDRPRRILLWTGLPHSYDW